MGFEPKEKPSATGVYWLYPVFLFRHHYQQFPIRNWCVSLNVETVKPLPNVGLFHLGAVHETAPKV